MLLDWSDKVARPKTLQRSERTCSLKDIMLLRVD